MKVLETPSLERALASSQFFQTFPSTSKNPTKTTAKAIKLFTKFIFFLAALARLLEVIV
jgi:hypothetical protein